MNFRKISIAAALGMAASTSMAAIIDSGPISYAVPQTTAGLYVNFVTGAHGTPAQAGAWDFNPYGSANLNFFASNLAANTAAVVTNGAGIALALNAGDTIGAGNSYQINGAAQTTGTAFRNTGIEIVGISFNNEVTGVTNYGYAQVQTIAPNGIPATVLRYIYENTGLPITVATPAPTVLFAYNRANNHLVSFDATAPGTLLSDMSVVGLAPTESILGIDFRPANGLLYATTNNGGVQRVVTIDTATALAQPVITANTLATPAGGFFGVDFNPTVDRLREVSDGDANLRLNPGTGLISGTDTSLAYVAGDPNAGVNPNVVHVAYINNFPGATLTTLYGIDSATDSLVMIGGVNGVPSPNGGQLTTIGALGVAIGDVGGFDIHFNLNTAYAALQVGGVSSLYTINLTTGAATLVGQIGTLTQVDGLSVAFSSAPKLLAVDSRKIHGVTTYDQPLSNLRTNPTTEPRQGPTQTVVFTFNVPISGAGYTISVLEGIASIGAVSTVGNQSIVDLAGVTDAQYVTLGITNVADLNGNGGGGGTVRVGFLAGDVNQSRVVTLTDVLLVNGQLAQPVSAANFLRDINASGTLTLTDKALTNTALTHALPPP